MRAKYRKREDTKFGEFNIPPKDLQGAGNAFKLLKIQDWVFKGLTGACDFCCFVNEHGSKIAQFLRVIKVLIRGNPEAIFSSVL